MLPAGRPARRSVPGPLAPDLPAVAINDNRTAAGTLADGALALRLELRRAMWPIMGGDEPGGEVLAFAEEGGPPQIPAPLVRVPLGTEVRIAVRNPEASTLVVHGLSGRRAATPDSLVVPAGESRHVRFTADAEGTYYYWGTTTGSAMGGRRYEDAALAGALVVDPAPAAAAPADRVFVMGMWWGGADESGEPDFGREFLVINGRPWPLTERLTHEVGDSIRWRLINTTPRVHPMHLHGFYFRVDARGDLALDTLYDPARRRMAVTERMAPGTTMAIFWSPDRPGGWLFHCHLNWHVIANPSLGSGRESAAEREAHLMRGHGADPHRHVLTAMGGLMLAVDVRAPVGWAPEEPGGRRLRLFVQSDSAAGDARPRFGYVLQEGEREPAPDSVRAPGSPIVLRRGEPTRIAVINRTAEPTQVHWHGLEIDSYYDGVTGVGGHAGRPTPAIMPGDSFEVRLTPPRAGTFMYHTHVNDVRQQSAGLYGALVVLPEDGEWDAERDRVVVLSSDRDFSVLLDGARQPEAMEMRVGGAYRLRLMNITIQNANVVVRVTRDGEPLSWLPLAKDGFDLPADRRVRGPAMGLVSIGETFDAELVPDRPGEAALEVRTAAGEVLVGRPIRIVE